MIKESGKKARSLRFRISNLHCHDKHDALCSNNRSFQITDKNNAGKNQEIL